MILGIIADLKQNLSFAHAFFTACKLKWWTSILLNNLHPLLGYASNYAYKFLTVSYHFLYTL